MWKHKWLWIGGALTAVAAAALLWPRASALPHVARELPATTTAGFVSAEGLDQLSKHSLDTLAAWLPNDATASWLDAGVRKTILGFDPVDAAAWLKAGIDPTKGLASVWDTQTGLGPLTLAAVADAGANDGWWHQQFSGVPDKAFDASAVAEWRAQHATSQLALQLKTTSRGDWRAVQAVDLAEPATAGAGLGAWRGATGPTLDADPVFQAAMEGIPAGPRVVGYGNLGLLMRLLRPGDDPALVAKAEAWLSRSWRAVSYWWTPGKVGFRLVATTAGVEILRKALEVDTPADPVVDALPGSAVVAFRWTVNPREVLDAVADQLPNEFPEIKSGFAAARLGMPLAMGIGETEFGAALSGHFAVALSGPLTAEGLHGWFVVGLRDPAKAADLMQRLGRKLDWPLQKTDYGWSVTLGSFQLQIRANDKVWVVTNATEPVDGAAASWRDHLRGDAVFAVTLEGSALYDALAKVLGKGAAPALAPGRWHLALRRTSTGLEATGFAP